MATTMVPMIIAVGGSGMLASAALGYMVASAKRRNASFWGAMGFVFPPAVLLTFFLRPHTPEEQRHRALRRWREQDD